MDLTAEMCDLIKQTAKHLPLGAARRCFMAQTLDSLRLSQRQACRAFGWARDTIRKALWERRTAQTPRDAFHTRGRKRAEFHLPNLLQDIKDVVHDHLQTDPTFATTQLYCRLSAAEVRRQLISRKGYTDEQLPTIKTITDKLNTLGFRLRKVAKCRPLKKVPQTNAIFDHVKEVHEQIQDDPHTLRLSLDSKAPVVIGPFSRGGQTRLGTKGADHDFKPEGTLGLFGIFQPGTCASDLYFTSSKITSDYMVDCLEQWLEDRAETLKEVRKLVLDLDNGPENSGQRSQWLLRLLQLAQKKQWHLVLVYYPPYHSKYNPIERFWGVLEKYWGGVLLNSEPAVLGYAAHMTYNGVHPTVHRNHQEYAKGVKLKQRRKKHLEKWLERQEGLEKWAIDLPPPPPDQALL